MDTENDKLQGLSDRIRDAAAIPAAKPAEVEPGRNIGVDFVGSIVICGVVGALVDRAFQTGPWGLVGMVLFGFAVGVYSAWRAIQK